MTHEEIVLALGYLHPNVEWNYTGDGSTLDPVEHDDGEVWAGLEWHGSGKPPTLADLEAALDEAQAVADHEAAQAAPVDTQQIQTVVQTIHAAVADLADPDAASLRDAIAGALTPFLPPEPPPAVKKAQRRKG